jgi:DNA-binding response OmpR family regulator
MPRRLELISPQGKVVQVSHKESRILVVLASHDEKLSVRKLVEAMDEDWPLYEKNRLELLLSRLRHKIRATSELSGNPIKSVRNEGYQLTIELRVGEED